jgi:hypothetical protein
MRLLPQFADMTDSCNLALVRPWMVDLTRDCELRALH